MRELREAIIHLDGSEQNVKNLSLDIAPDIQQIGDDVTRFTLECVSELPVKTPVYALLIALIKSNSEGRIARTFSDVDGAPFIVFRFSVAVEIVGSRQRTTRRIAAKRVCEDVVA
jgi:hypothetical protein